jgi:hypothetical protein
VSLGASRLFEFARLCFLAAERVRLAMMLTSGFIQELAEFAVLSFHFGQAADQALVIPP